MDTNMDMFFLISHIYHPEITLMSQEEVLEEVKKSMILTVLMIKGILIFTLLAQSIIWTLLEYY